MATKLVDIRELIKDKIAPFIAGDVFEYPNGPAGLNKYPSAVILPTGGTEGEVQDTGRNLRVWAFDIFVYQEQTPSGKTKEQANDVMTTLIDNIVESFDKDNNLNFSVSRIRVVSMSFDYSGANGPYVIATFKVECEVLVQNYS